MNIIENFKMSFDSIKSNKLRSFLTMLGIIIGISSVIAIVALGQGGKNAISGEFEKIGASTINIKVNSSKAEKSDYITFEDIRFLRENISALKYISPVVQKRGTIASDKKSKMAVITGGSTELAYVENSKVVYGRYFNEREFNEGSAVVVMDEASANTLFGFKDVVGKVVKIGHKNAMKKAEIVGVVEGFRNPFSDNDTEMPAFISVPVSFQKSLYSWEFYLDTLSIVASSQSEVESVGSSARNILESRHSNRSKDIYNTESVLKQLEQIEKVLDIFTAFIGAVAGISLIVGGIGVMNIMLVSVTERTREIGIRKALGATTRAILLQFLTEAVIISLLGGIAGMIIGIVGAEAAGRFIHISPAVSLKIIIITIIFSSAVGIFFGIYPASKAAKLNPIDALRYE